MPMSTDAIVLLRSDHKEVRKLFTEFQSPKTKQARKGSIVAKVIELLTVHTYIENEVTACLQSMTAGVRRRA